jgi:hypothetical protein
VDEIKIPEELDGPWEHVLILTYNVDIPFFENALWLQLPNSCRNRIILADGKSFLDSCSALDNTKRVHRLNQQYIGEGVQVPRISHAKLILLTNEKEGRLLVGSGNLNLSGYASGGELYTKYEYSESETGALGAFISVRELVENLVSNRYISPMVEKHIQHLLEKSPWLFQAPSSSWRPVRCNMYSSFIDQLQEEIGKDYVEEIAILSPFYDEKAKALEEILKIFKPKIIKLFIQEGRTSADPLALKSVLDSYANRWEIFSFARGEKNPYIHAKLYLFKLETRSVCLQGSPNLSQVAMLLTFPLGNIEAANLVHGLRNEFDYIIDSTHYERLSTPLEQIDISIKENQENTETMESNWYLTSGEWHGDRITIFYKGKLPNLSNAELVIEDVHFPIILYRSSSYNIEIRADTQVQIYLDRSIPIRIGWYAESNPFLTNAIFICNRKSLESTLSADACEFLNKVGDLNINDEELNNLIYQLENYLVINKISLWQLAGHSNKKDEKQNPDDNIHIKYEDIDYELLHRHPRLRQYIYANDINQNVSPTRLQIVLKSITDHFQNNNQLNVAMSLLSSLTETEAESETEAEREEIEKEKESKHRTWEHRAGLPIKRFIKRYLEGISDPQFRNTVGFEIMLYNYVIFMHILGRLFHKSWMEPEALVDAFVKTNIQFWGGAETKGYFSDLLSEQRAQLHSQLREYYIDSELLESFFQSIFLLDDNELVKLKLSLRDLWRHLLTDLPFEITSQTLDETEKILNEFTPNEALGISKIVNELENLAYFNSKNKFLRDLEKLYGLEYGTTKFTQKSIFGKSGSLNRSIISLVIDSGKVLDNVDKATEILHGWMHFQELDYYRIENQKRVFYYDVLEQLTVFWEKGTQTPVSDPGRVLLPVYKWETTIQEMGFTAEAGKVVDPL